MNDHLRCIGLLALLPIAAGEAAAEPIDRHALVARHNVVRTDHDPAVVLSVGNGEFAFNFDVTGLQTFPGETPLTTMAQWAWHRHPESRGADYAETLRDYDVWGRSVSYATARRTQAAQLIRANPHRFNLGRLALRLTHADGTPAAVDDLREAHQVLDLWSGSATSTFRFDGEPVRVTTVAHPRLDAVAVEIESPFAAAGRLAVDVSFAYPSGDWGPGVDDPGDPERHTTELVRHGAVASLRRTIDQTAYGVRVQSDGEFKSTAEPHEYRLRPTGERLAAVFHFVEGDATPDEAPPEFAAVREAAAEHWRAFWTTGGAIDLSGSRDPRWRELERRIVLSQYLTAVHGAGSLPPQETGLICNSWHGKHHLEMQWWHAAHFAPWGRFELLQRSLGYYERILPAARRIAQRQGYAGVRWPKMTGPEGVSSPSDVGELLVWQQPHPIWFAEQAYRVEPTDATLRRWAPLVEATAAFMADYAHHDAPRDRYVLGPILIPAQERYFAGSEAGVLNPTFELAYWRWGLRTANAWRRRVGRAPDETWREVAEKLARPTVREGVYAAVETAPHLEREDHPSLVAALGLLPDVGLIDRATMDRTLDSVAADWDGASTWGWDCPMLAMTATRLGRPADAVDFLLRDTPKNRYDLAGHCYQRENLPVYLPANGGLLYAAAMMAAGWDDAAVDTPGFPDDGSWTVRHEGLRREAIP